MAEFYSLALAILGAVSPSRTDLALYRWTDRQHFKPKKEFRYDCD